MFSFKMLNYFIKKLPLGLSTRDLFIMWQKLELLADIFVSSTRWKKV
jgi:hypothetical protein